MDGTRREVVYDRSGASANCLELLELSQRLPAEE
jgi:hypothetical protein